MRDSDRWAITLDYVDCHGRKTQRVISPIRFLGRDRVLALCLSRCEPRQFQLDRCTNMQIQPASNFLMPVTMPA
ncbi:MAG: hypothetical protein KF752_09255 [Pirellulaceae bacterium]|nr:hypothetical protein [Pirellulaceae bacterium]